MKNLLSSLLNTVLPQRCPSCRVVLDHQSEPGLCGACWQKITFLTDSACISCALPFEHTSNEAFESLIQDQSDFEPNTNLDDTSGSGRYESGHYCAECLKTQPPFSKTKAAVLYDQSSKDLILKFKHGDATHLAPIFASWLEQANNRSLHNFFEDTDVFIPVPLHWTRLLKRKFNQASLLSNALSKRTGIPTDHHFLKRVRRTKSQGHLSPEDRIKNVRGKFSINPKKTKDFKEKVITLIDDVYTSGATVTACAQELKKAGVKDVYVLTLARVARL